MKGLQVNKKLLLVAAVFACNSLLAQTKIIDSLKTAVAIAGDDTKKLAALFLLCDQANSMHPDTLSYYYKLAKQIVEKRNDPVEKATVALYETGYLLRSGQLDSAEKIINDNLPLLTKENTWELRNRFLSSRSGILIRSNRQKESIENSLRMLSDAEQNKKYEFVIKACNVLGWAYMELGQNTEALNWLFRAVQTDSLTGHKYTNAVIYSNIAATLNELKKNDSAELFIKKAIDLARKTQNLYAFTNSMYIYSDICIDKGNNAKAASLLEEGLSARRQVGDPFYIISDITQMAIFYAHNKQPEKGIIIIQEGIAMAEKNNLPSKLPILYSALAENYKASGNQAKYAETLTRVIDLKDSLYQKNTAEELREMETKYDVQKKSNLIIQQKLDLVKKNYLFYGSLAALILAAVFFYLLFKSYRRKQKMKLEMMQAIEKQMAEKAVVEAEENERRRIATDLHDNLGAYANAVLYNTELLEKEGAAGERRRLMGDLKDASKDIIGSLRETIWALKKDHYTAEDCLLRISNFIQPFNRYYQHISFKVEGDAPAQMDLRYSKALNVVRIVQEAVTNAIKHSGAKNVVVNSSMDAGRWKLQIVDDGKGFDLPAMRGRGNGLTNMEQRAAQSGFEFSLQTGKDGTAITMKV